MLMVVKARAELAKTGGGGSAGGFMASGDTGTGLFNEASGLSAMQQQIQSIVRNYRGQEGISVQQVCEQLRGVPEKKIR